MTTELATPALSWRLVGMTNTLLHADAAPLETGWLSTTPDGDNIVTDMTRAQAIAYRSLATAAGHAIRVEPDLGLSMTDSNVASPFGNVATLSRPLTADETRRAVDAMRSFYGSASGGPFIIFAAWPTPELDTEGFSLAGYPPLMVRWGVGQIREHAGAVVRQVAATGELADFERTLIEGYPAPELQPWRAGCFLAPEVLGSGWRFFVGYDEGQPVAAAASFSTSTVTLIEMVAVRESARGKGFGAAVTAAAAVTDPSRPAVLISSDLGRPVYTGLGFTPISRFSCWIGQR